MGSVLHTPPRAAVAAAIVIVLLGVATLATCYTQSARSRLGGPLPAGAALQRLDGVWIEGPGYEITYGGDYEGCSRLCLRTERCRMIEYYKPERKCNLYDSVRPRRQGGASIVGIRQATTPETGAPLRTP